MKCVICETETGSDKRRTCSGSCRAKAHRQRTRTPDNEAHAEERTRPDDSVVVGGTCWCCGNEIHEALVCCGPCAWSGKAKAKRAGAAPPRTGGDRHTLHPAIIAVIKRLTTKPDGTISEHEQLRRMSIATDYEKLYPGRPYTGTGL